VDDHRDGSHVTSRSWKPLALLVLVGWTVGCDRVTKHYAQTTWAGTPGRTFLADTVRVEYVENTGGFLSLGAELPPAVRTAVFTLGNGLLLLVTIVVAIRLRRTRWPLIGICLFISGGASNLIDRVAMGSVVDFLNVGIGPLRTGIFNVADVAIVMGMAVLVVSHQRSEDDARPDQEAREP
jgi:signal peptidase II